MIIDWHKYTRLLLPSSWRNTILIELIRTLFWQVPKAAASFNLWEMDAQYKAAYTGSVIELERMIYYELNIAVEISELDGKPFDYLVSFDGEVDETKLRTILDQYNFGGKTYTLAVGGIIYSVAFTNYVCENRSNPITMDYEVFSSNATIYAEAWAAVQTDLVITGTFKRTDGGVVDIFDFEMTMLAGTKTAQVNGDVADSDPAYTWAVEDVVITPSTDEFYDYTVE